MQYGGKQSSKGELETYGECGSDSPVLGWTWLYKERRILLDLCNWLALQNHVNDFLYLLRELHAVFLMLHVGASCQ